MSETRPVGERVGLPQHASRKAHKPRGPAQKPLEDVLAVEDVRAQLGDGALERLVQSELRSRERSDGNARVNPDVRADAALYDDGVGGAFERSVFIDPTRSARSGGGGGEGRQVQVKAPPLGSDAKAIPVAYETAAVGSRIANMARVGGQRVRRRRGGRGGAGRRGDCRESASRCRCRCSRWITLWRAPPRPSSASSSPAAARRPARAGRARPAVNSVSSHLQL